MLRVSCSSFLSSVLPPDVQDLEDDEEDQESLRRQGARGREGQGGGESSASSSSLCVYDPVKRDPRYSRVCRLVSVHSENAFS